jgi:hypothetical protein
MNSEHFWPEWLIELTRTAATPVGWIPGRKVPPRATTVPMCVQCNADFGRELEGPTARVFRDVLAGRGLSGNEAELLVRWLWKFEGLSWRIANHRPTDSYSEIYTIRDRVLRRIGSIRDELALAISLVERIDYGFTDEPMGLDSSNRSNAVFVSGVFSRIAMMSTLRVFSYGLPDGFTVIQLPSVTAADGDTKLYFPRVGFPTCTEAVVYMRQNAPQLALQHDAEFERLATMSGN